MNSGYEQPAGPTIFVIYRPNMSSNIINLYMDGFWTQRSFHRFQEHPKRSSNKEIMTVRIWRLPMNNGYVQLAGPTVFMISGHNISSNIIKLYMDGF